MGDGRGQVVQFNLQLVQFLMCCCFRKSNKGNLPQHCNYIRNDDVQFGDVLEGPEKRVFRKISRKYRPVLVLDFSCIALLA